MRRLPDNLDPEDHRIHRKWAKGFFVFYGVLMIVAAGLVFGNRLSNNPTHEVALAGAGGEKLQTAHRAARPLSQTIFSARRFLLMERRSNVTARNQDPNWTSAIHCAGRNWPRVTGLVLVGSKAETERETCVGDFRGRSCHRRACIGGLGTHRHHRHEKASCRYPERRRPAWRCRKTAVRTDDGERTPMSREKPNDDPRQRTDWKNTKQTDEPWKGPVEKEQKPGGPPPDLENRIDSSP